MSIDPPALSRKQVGAVRNMVRRICRAQLDLPEVTVEDRHRAWAQAEVEGYSPGYWDKRLAEEPRMALKRQQAPRSLEEIRGAMLDGIAASYATAEMVEVRHPGIHGPSLGLAISYLGNCEPKGATADDRDRWLAEALRRMNLAEGFTRPYDKRGRNLAPVGEPIANPIEAQSLEPRVKREERSEVVDDGMAALSDLAGGDDDGGSPPPASGAANVDLVAHLRRLKAALEAGLISKAQHDAAVNKALGL